MRRIKLDIYFVTLIAFQCLVLHGLSGCNAHRELNNVVNGDAILQSSVIRHGVDTIKIFEVKSDEETLNRMIATWRLEEVQNDEGMTFLNNDAPSWWRSDMNVESNWQRYSQSDETTEQYRSVWYSEAENRAYIELGQW